MHLRKILLISSLLAIAVFTAACGVGATSTPVPASTSTPTPVPAPTSTPTPTPIPSVTPTGSRPGWLNDLVIRFEQEPVANPAISIFEYEYKGETVYFVPQRCCDIFSDLYDAGGALIAHPDGGIAGHGDGRASDFFETAKLVRTVWTDHRGEESFKRELTKAPIESVDVAIMESFPVQYRVNVVSGLPSGCARFDHWELSVDAAAHAITIDVYNSVPAAGEAIACTMIYGYVEHSIGIDGIEPGHTYTVTVNDHQTQFTSQ